MLNVVVDSLDNVPEGAREHYAERDGKFQLDLTGAFSTLDRDTLLGSLRKERDVSAGHAANIKAFGEFTPESIHELEGERDQLKIEVAAVKRDGGPNDEDIDKIVEARVMARLAPVQRELTRSNESIQTLTGERDSLAKAQTRDLILREVTGAFGVKELGANPDARVDVELWATSAFEVDDNGKVVSKESAGVVPGLNPSDVFKDMKDNSQRRHWFGLTTGAGATGNDGGKDTGGSNSPFTIDKSTGRLKNLTAAGAMVREDPERAKRMAAAAGAQKFFPRLFS